MAMKWTEAQEKVITTRDRNLLVSAAAGSGKTAVLVERICQRVMDREHPCDIDELLVVTFTKAAAAEMKGRIAESLEKRLQEDANNAHLQKQVVLSRNAMITTIDGFCLNLIKEHFYLLDMEPGFSTMDENEKLLLMEDVFDEVVNEYYKKRTPEFIAFVENYCTGKKDKELSEFVFSMYQNATSHPWPKAWLRECVETYRKVDVENHPLARAVFEEAKIILKDVLCELSNAIKETEEIPELEKLYLDLINIKEGIADVASKESFEGLRSAVRGYKFVDMPRITLKDDAIKEIKDKAKQVRDWTKDKIKKLSEGYFSTGEELLKIEGELGTPMMKVLCELTEDFMDAFATAKRKLNRVDFNDMEHMALEILINEDGTETDVARACKKQYKEIMIDEYQDSNLLQEYILGAVSTCNEGKNNIFMVGDVKQSIYRFRLARPDMFVEKYNRYTMEDSKEQKILLDKNFRSRAEVLDFSNDVFRSLMRADFGDIEYDTAAELKVGAEYINQESHSFNTEILLVDGETFDGRDFSKERAESFAIAARILKEVKEGRVTDKETGLLRPTRFSDIVVLSRSTVWWDVLKEVLTQQKIPAIVTGNTGYFDSMEIVIALAFLQVLDNRMQDIPLASVLTSCIGNINKEELAIIKQYFKEETFAKACVMFAVEADELLNERERKIKSKLNKVLSLVDDFKKRATYEPVYELLEEIYEETGLYYQMGVLPQGNIRMQNLDMLIEKAYSFEHSSYHELYHFLRYIGKIRKYEIDFPISGDAVDLNAVRIMTIHKSKGLEFPVVIVGALSRQFNTIDTKGRLITHPEYGAALEITDGIKRTRRQGFFKQAMKAMVQKENLAEEIRILYVALTRAKEKLILCGYSKEREKDLKVLEHYQSKSGPLSYSDKNDGISYQDWLLKILAPLQHKYPVQFLEFEKLNTDLIIQHEDEVKNQPWFLQDMDIEGQECLNRATLLDEITRQFSFVYPYANEGKVPLKMSVSDIKHHVMEQIFLEGETAVEEVVPDFLVEEKQKKIPQFMKESEEKKVNPGALRGTAFHRVMECMDFSDEEWITLANKDSREKLDQKVEAELNRQLEEGLITEEYAELIYIGKISNFLCTPLFKELHAASKDEKLRKEQPFVMGIDASQAGLELPDMDSHPTILVQGIIDVFYEKDGAVTLLDYKTDKVQNANELILRYKKQMELYSEAIYKATGKVVNRIVLYSFSLEETIDVVL